ncbi:hypothetical protein [Treponema primitia]|nr:hypothetical protein [Treponema primitia]
MLFDRLVNSILEERRQDREEERKYFLDLLEQYTPEQIKAKLMQS